MTDEASTVPRAGALQRLGESAATRLAWMVAKALVTVVVTGSIAMATGYVREMRDDIRTATQKVEDLKVAQHDTNGRVDSTNSRVDSLQKVSDATVIALQQLGKELNHTQVDVEVLKADVAHSALRTGRPR